MPHNTSRLEAVATIGIDIGKNTFHLVGLDRNGAIVLRQKLSRRQIEAQDRWHGGLKWKTQWFLLGRVTAAASRSAAPSSMAATSVLPSVPERTDFR